MLLVQVINDEQHMSEIFMYQGRIFSFQKGGLHEWDTANFEIAARSAANHFVALL